MICLRAAFPLTSSSSSPLRRLALKPSSSRAAVLRVAAMSSAIAAPVEHIVLIKVRPEAAVSGAAAAMVSSLQALSSVVPGLSYIHVGPVLRLRSPAAEALGPTHVLHSRYATKPDLAAATAGETAMRLGSSSGSGLGRSGSGRSRWRRAQERW
uniref:Stress-response A/B barrel domain-containing protein n=1 Tax=Oryza glumipatula TaxID=40148 RepID=A0A0E0AMJ5_9ORYZ